MVVQAVTLLVDRTMTTALEAEVFTRLWMRKHGIAPEPILPPSHAAQAIVDAQARRFNVLVCGRRWGKTQHLIRRLIEPAVQGFPTAWFAPDYKRVDEPFRAVLRACRPLIAYANKTDRRIELTTGGVMEFWTLDSNGPGRGRKYKRVEVDESGLVPDLEEKWEQDIRPTLTDMAGEADFGGTPKGFNYFHALYDRGQKGMNGDERFADWASWQMPTLSNPTIPNLADELRKVQEELSAEAFMQEYEAQFVTDATQIFLPVWWTGVNRFDADAIEERPTRISGRWIVWDTALKDKEENAYSARVVGEVLYSTDPVDDGILILREVWRGRPQFPALVDEIHASARAWNYDGKLERVIVEDKASGTSAVQTIRATAPDWLADRISAFEPSGSKIERWSKAAVWCKRGCVRLPLPSSSVAWRRDFEEELFALPFAQFKDQGDAFAELLIYLEHLLEAGWRRRAGGGVGEEAAA